MLRHFRLVFNSVKSHFRDVEKRAGVAGAQLWAMGIIESHPGIGVSELARTMHVHQSTASNLVRTLIDRRLVAAEKKGADRRGVQLRLQPAGMQALRRAPAPFVGVLPQALARMEPEALARLDIALQGLIEALDGDEAGGDIPLGQEEG